MPAVALTDHGNLFAMVKFHREAEKRGVKPVIGAISGSPTAASVPSPLLRCLRRTTRFPEPHAARVAELPGRPGTRPALLAREWLDAATTSGLIALSGGPGRRRPRAAGGPPAKPVRSSRAGRSSSATGTTSRSSVPAGRARKRTSQECRARRRPRAPVVATNDVRFLAAMSSRRTRHVSASAEAIDSMTRGGRGHTRQSNT